VPARRRPAEGDSRVEGDHPSARTAVVRADRAGGSRGGDASVRGGIIDFYSPSSDNPYRIEFDIDVIDTIRFHSDSSESVRGMMKPKSEEEIMNSVKTIEPKRRMEIAATQGMTNVLKDAVKNGADFRHNADFILRVACYNGQLDIVKFLVDKGADVNAVKGQPLYQAFARGYVDVARYLLEHGADIKVIMNFRQMERPVNAETKRQLRELRTEFSEKANEV